MSNQQMTKLIYLALLSCLFIVVGHGAWAQVPDANGIIYVNKIATGNATGSSWNNAVPELADALLAAQNLNALNAETVKEIWVAKGTYKPKYSIQDGYSGVNQGRDNAFLLVNNVKLYGGFPDLGNPGMADRDWKTNPSILSADIDNNDTFDANGNITSNRYTGNAYHVVVAVSVNDAELNGFTIISANAGGGSFVRVNTIMIHQSNGGGVYNYSSSPSLTNVVIKSNMATNGGGMYNVSSSNPKLTNVTFSGNSAASGGGMYNNQSSPNLTNVVFSGNLASPNGGGIYGTGSNVTLTNVTMSGNTATSGGAMYNSGPATPQIRNSIIYGNSSGITNVSATPALYHSLIEGSTNTTNGNIDATGIIVNQIFNGPLAPAMGTKGDYTLKTGSPAIGTGSNALFADLNASSKDLAGSPRLDGVNIDMGAFEYQSTLPVNMSSYVVSVQNDRAKLQWNTLSEEQNKAFIISRSTDGHTYSELGRVKGAGTVKTPSSYTYYDNHPLYGTNYYRLQQLDYDGRLTELGIETINFKLSSTLISSYPNPTSDKVAISFQSGTFSRLEVVDLNGKVLYGNDISKEENSKQVLLGTYPVGTYIIKLSGSGKTETRKVLK